MAATLKPKTVEELLSPQGYLADLLEFCQDHVTQEIGPGLFVQVDTGLLTEKFFQPFGRLIDRAASVANDPIGRLRVPLEVLRSYLRESKPAPLLVGHWRCDEVTGTRLADSGPNKNDGTISAGATRVSGRMRGAVMFDGTEGSSITVPHSGPWLKLGDNNADFSVAFWLLLRQSHTGEWRAIIHKGSDDSSPQTRERTFALLMRPDDDRIHFRISTDAPITDELEEPRDQGGDSATEIQLGVWTHVAYVKAGERLQLYVDGRLDAQADLIGKTLSNEGPIHVGHSPFFPQGIEGGIDDIRIYAFALSQSTVRRLGEGRAADAPPGGPAGEDAYTWAAYEALLTQIGTSYAELRAVRRAAEEERNALGERLGITLRTADGEDTLAGLVPPIGGPTESWLEEMFGLADSTEPDPFRERPGVVLLRWRQEALRQRWKDEDHPEDGAADAPPIVDPDLIDVEDLRRRQPTDPLYTLLTERRKWVEDQEQAIREQLGGNPSAGEFAATLSSVLGPDVDLATISNAAASGQPIEQSLRAAHLTSVAFRRLLGARELAEQGELADPQRDDVIQILDDIIQILTEVRKEQQFPSWRAKEKDEGVRLSPDDFKLADREAYFRPWRASRSARSAWQTKLQERLADWERLETNSRTSIVGTEERALPLLRDALVAGIADEQVLPQVADRLSGLLFVDLNHSGIGPTTRAMEAVETVQGIVNAVRGRGIGSDHPAAGWDIAAAHPGGLAAFDEEWGSMGSHPGWQAALSVFLYPENALLPTLRPDGSGAFKALIADLRKLAKLTPEGANSSYGPREADLNEDEKSFHAPALLALELQKAGYYVAALSWLSKIYDHSLPPEKRKIYDRLRSEENQAPTLNQDDHWTRDLNPHSVAKGRLTVSRKPWNAYTRFTLMTLARCLLEYADSEFATDTSESVAHARSLYLRAQDLLSLPDLDTIPPADPRQVLLPNSVTESLQTHARAQLAKVRSGRNVAGLRRRLELLTAPTREEAVAVAAGAPAPVQTLPTPYRYATLIERSKQLVAIAQQVEANYFAALEKQDFEDEKLAREGVAIEIGDATVTLHTQRVRAAQNGTELARRQRARSETAKNGYDDWISDGLNHSENMQIDNLKTAQNFRSAAVGFEAIISMMQFSQDAVSGSIFGSVLGAAAAPAFAGLQGLRAGAQILAGDAETAAQIASIRGSHERRLDEWRLQSALADQDVKIGDQQVQLALDEELIRSQELRVAEVQRQGAQLMRDFLLGKFTSAELYAWLAGVLSGIYAYFLQQAASTAQLAQSQLSFERQETPSSYIQSDYWRLRPEAAKPAGGTEGNRDRRGLTGSARLQEDIYRLEQHAFETDRRRLNLAQTFSLARLAPFEFEVFKDTGTLPFATPLTVFDQGFPGHYLRLIKRVRTALVALVPPNQGIRATLMASGISRVVVGPGVFRPMILRRDPEQVALTSPAGATGVFELDPQPELLLPFEGGGVDTQWQFVMPKAANAFDYRTIADLLVTIEYTALHSFDYQQQVLRTLDRTIDAERTFSARTNLPDAWYDLNNPDRAEHPWEVHLETRRADFPSNLMSPVLIRQILALVVPKPGATPAEGELALAYTFEKEDGDVRVGPLTAKLQAGVVSTRRTDGNSAWGTALRNKPAAGKWVLQIPDASDLRDRFRAGEIEDIILVLTFSGQRPPWPEL